MTALLLLFASPLIGCMTIPAYDEALYKHLSTVADDVGNIHTAIEVTHTPPVTADVVAPYYTDAFTHLDEAANVAAGRSIHHRRGLAKRPAELEVEAIENCRKALTAEFDHYKTSPVAPDLERTFDDRVVCGVPKTMEQLLKRGI